MKLKVKTVPKKNYEVLFNAAREEMSLFLQFSIFRKLTKRRRIARSIFSLSHFVSFSD